MLKKRTSRKSNRIPLQIYGPKLFTFQNGDSYEGEFSINLLTNQIFRHGKGIYKTYKDVSYNGTWNNDKIIGKIQINFPDGSSYNGEVNEILEFTNGIYTFPDKTCLMGNFENFPNNDNEEEEILNLQFKDINERIWIPFYKDGKIKLKYPWNFNNNDKNNIDGDDNNGKDEVSNFKKFINIQNDFT